MDAHVILNSPRRLAPFALALALVGTVTLESRGAGAAIPFRNGAPPARVRNAAEVRAALTAWAAREESRHAVVQFRHTLAVSDRASLKAAGLTVQRSLGARAYTALRGTGGMDVNAIMAAGSLADVRPFETVWKLSPFLSSGEVPTWAVVNETDPTRPVLAAYVLFHPDVDLESDATGLAAMYEAVVRDYLWSVNGLVVELPLDAIPALAGEDAVLYMESALPPLGANNAENRAVTQADLVQDAPYDLDGSGVTVLVYDVGEVFDAHPDFGGRAHRRDGSGRIAHPTHVAGTIGGSGAASGGLYRGMAPGVTIESYGLEDDHSGYVLYTNPGDIEQDYDQAINVFGADIANNSIGTNVAPNGLPCEFTGDYGVTSALIDAIVRGSLGEPFRTVWANGNERQTARCGASYHTTAPPACAKNHITVGALDADDEQPTWFTSWGPTDDGRLKPDVTAPGCQQGGDGGVTSTTYDPVFGEQYDVFCGTSMASPTVCGLAALLLQDYREQFPGQPDFRNSTLKILLAHTAVDLGNPGPDYQYGYGSVRIRQAIDFMRTGHFVERELEHDGRYTFVIDVQPGVAELKVTLAWDDVPATPLVSPALVNDLDIRVFDPLGSRYLPWTLDPSDPGAWARQTEADHLNNIEQVFVADPAPGTWLVEIHGHGVPEGPQPFSVCASPNLEVGAIQFQFPQGFPSIVPPGVPTAFPVDVVASGEIVTPGSPALHISVNGGAFETSALTSLGGDRYEAVLPAVDCGDSVALYFSAAGSLSGAVSFPPGAPASSFGVTVGEQIEVFVDDMEIDRGWIAGAPDDDATNGIWNRADPEGTDAQPENDHTAGTGSICWVTDSRSGGTVSEWDVDGGKTTLLSPAFDLSDLTDPVVSYWRWYSNDQGTFAPDDVFQVDVSDDDGANWTNAETIGPDGPETSGEWITHSFHLVDFVGLTAQVRLRFVASDFGSASIVEAAVDDLRIESLECATGELPGDLDGDGDVDLADLAQLLADYGCTGGDCPADLDGDGDTDLGDLAILLANYGTR